MASGEGGVRAWRRSANSTACTMSSRESIRVPSRSKTTPRFSRDAAGQAPAVSDTVTSVDGVTDEEGSHLYDELRGLTCSAHGLHDVRQRMKLLADESDHELVVVRIEPVT